MKRRLFFAGSIVAFVVGCASVTGLGADFTFADDGGADGGGDGGGGDASGKPDASGACDLGDLGGQGGQGVDACKACLALRCCQQSSACAKDATCKSRVSCALGCTGSGSRKDCVNNCFDTSDPTLDQFNSCAQTSCNNGGGGGSACAILSR
jgi:hypothetical protein